MIEENIASEIFAQETFIEEKFTTYSTQMRVITKDMAELTIDCRAKFRAAELKAERDSILKIDKFNSDWKHLQQSIEKMIENRDECELEENHNDIKVSIKLLKEVLIDIEV